MDSTAQRTVQWPGALPAARWGREFIFTGLITPHDLDSGYLVTSPPHGCRDLQNLLHGSLLVDVPRQLPVSQAWAIYTNLTSILERGGSSLDRVARQRVFVTDVGSIPLITQVMDLFFPSEQKPATTFVQIPRSEGLARNVSVQIDAVALVDKSQPLERILDPDSDSVSPRFPAAVRAGDVLFVEGTLGKNPATGQLGKKAAELPDAFLDGELVLGREQQEILAQSWFSFARIRSILEASGSSLGQLLKVNGWLDFLMKDFAPVVFVRERLFTRREELCASTALGIGGLSEPRARLSFEGVALSPGGRYEKKVLVDASTIASYYVGVVQGGPYVFTCGEVPINTEIPKPIRSFDDVGEEGRRLLFGRIDRVRSIQAKAWFTYKQHHEYLAAHGCSFHDVLHQTVYLVRPQEFGDVLWVAQHFFGTELPPTTLVPITDTSPYPEVGLEIELIAETPERSQSV